MRSRSTSRLILALFALIVGFTGRTHAAVQDRVTGAISERTRATLKHTVAPKVTLATDLGAAPVSRTLEGITLHFGMTDTQQAALQKLLSDQQNPGSPQYHQWLTPQQFGAQFGISSADIARVSSWLTSQGFTVTGVANGSTFITFNGTVDQVQHAFGVAIHTLSLNGEQHIATLNEPSLPGAIAAVVTTITGLDDFKLKPHVHVRSLSTRGTTVRPQDTITVTTGSGVTSLEHFISPDDFYTIYDLNTPLSGSPGNNGAGISIAVVGQVDISLADIAAFRTASGLNANVPTIKTYGADPGAPTGNCLSNNPPQTCTVTGNDLDESELDVEWAGATAPSANIIFVNSTDVIGTSLVQAIDNNLAPIMTVSYGGCETLDFPLATMTSLNTTFQQGNAQGITIVGASGDSGATDCETSGTQSATHGLAVDFPGSSPFVTAVGGTEFSEGADTATPNGTYWNNTTTSVSSALSYIPETVWNDTAAGIAANPTTAVLAAGGGGASAVFPKPVWQAGLGVPSDGKRDLPDVSFTASADHDAYLVCAQGSCQGGTYFTQSGANAGAFDAFGGTSVSTPSFAGVLALVEQKDGGARIGNANPYIYALANSASSSVFHDITTGNNSSPCTAGTTGCTTSPIGFSAGVGYDLATGWGSVDANNFINKFASVTLQTSTTTTVTLNPTAPALGQNVTVTATVVPGTGSAVPTGSVAFSVNGGTATTVAVTPQGTATYSTSFNTGGTQTVTAVYSGDTTFYGSTGSASASIVVTAGSATTTALALNRTSVAVNGPLTLTATVASAVSGTLAGTVVFNAGATVLGTATLNPSSSGNTGTATLNVTATAALLPIGTDNITATFGGGGTSAGGVSYLGSSSTAVPIMVTSPTLSLAANAISIASGALGTSTITITSGGGYMGTVNLTATATDQTLLNSGSVLFTPASVTFTNAGTATMTSTFSISTNSAVAALRGGTRLKDGRSPVSALTIGSTLSFAGLILFGLCGVRRKRWPAVLYSLVAFAVFASVVGCSSSSSTGGSGSGSTNVPPGTYSVTIVGTDSTNTIPAVSTTLTLTLK